MRKHEHTNKLLCPGKCQKLNIEKLYKTQVLHTEV